MTDYLTPRLEKLESQPEVQKLLKSFAGKPGAQTFLWAGPEGSGKKSYALSLTRSLFCSEGPACPGCATCRQVLNKTHPDLFWVHRDFFWSEDPNDKKKQGIVVDVAKRLSEKINQAPFSAPFKVAVILNSETLNKDAQNVLLKTLEEPPANTIIILLAEKTGNFLPTVLSRCRLIRFPALPSAKVENILIQSYGWKETEAKNAAQESAGNLALALKYGDGHWREFRDKVCADFDRALQGPEEDWMALASEYDKWEPEFLEEAERTATQRKAEVITAAFQVYLGLWSRRLSREAPTPTPLSALPADIVLKSLQKHQDMIPTNLNAKMILDHLFLELRDGFKTGEINSASFMEMAVKI